MKKSEEEPAGESKPGPEVINARLKEAFTWFVTHVPAKRLGRNLRTLVMEFMTYDGSETIPYREDLFFDLEGLFKLLDAVEDEAGEVQKRI